MLLASGAFAETKVNQNENRNITPNIPQDPTGAAVSEFYQNLTVSPTTGRTLSDVEVPNGYLGLAANGIYFPVMVQISSEKDDGKNGTYATGTGHRAPWNLQYADVIYELPLYKNGLIRMSAVFSDVLPSDVGPVRSARLGHVWVREEWDCGFAYYGQQEFPETNVIEEFEKTGARYKSKDGKWSMNGLLWPGTSGLSDSHPWKYFYLSPYKSKHYNNTQLKSPNDVSFDIAHYVQEVLLDDGHMDVIEIPQQQYHAYTFTDDPYTGGDAAETIHIDWKRVDTNETFKYDPATKQYSRYVQSEKKKTGNVLWVELESQEPITLSNVIVQWTETIYKKTNAPITKNIGDYVSTGVYKPAGGNAEIFMNGRHIAGYWYRDGLKSRTVFYDENGNEIPMQRGRTMIIQLPYEKVCTYE